MRHSFAMRMLRAGKALPIISLWLGHEDIETTMVYIHADLKMKREALELLSPIEQKCELLESSDKTDNLRQFLEDI